MYQPPQFQAKDRTQALDIIRAHPFASLISVDDAGLPFVTHLPLHVEEQADKLVLFGHCAKPNAHWKVLASAAAGGGDVFRAKRLFITTNLP